MPLAMAPLSSVTSPLASIAARSPAFSTAFAAVAVQTPATQLTLLVGAFDTTRAACAGMAARQTSVTAMAGFMRASYCGGMAIR